MDYFKRLFTVSQSGVTFVKNWVQKQTTTNSVCADTYSTYMTCVFWPVGEEFLKRAYTNYEVCYSVSEALNYTAVAVGANFWLLPVSPAIFVATGLANYRMHCALSTMPVYMSIPLHMGHNLLASRLGVSPLRAGIMATVMSWGISGVLVSAVGERFTAWGTNWCRDWMEAQAGNPAFPDRIRNVCYTLVEYAEKWTTIFKLRTAWAKFALEPMSDLDDIVYAINDNPFVVINSDGEPETKKYTARSLYREVSILNTLALDRGRAGITSIIRDCQAHLMLKKDTVDGVDDRLEAIHRALLPRLPDIVRPRPGIITY